MREHEHTGRSELLFQLGAWDTNREEAAQQGKQ